MAKVSIILSVYDNEQYLRQCLDSIINQTFKNFECVCINRYYKGNILLILEEYSKKDCRFKFISKENEKSTEIINNYLKNTSSQYVTFINSNDFISNKYIENLYNIIILHDYDISCTQSKIYNQNINKYYTNQKNIKRIKKILSKREINLVDIVKIVELSENVYSKMYKIDFLKNNNFVFYEEISLLTFITFIYTKKVVFIDDELYFNRTNNCIENNEQNKVVMFESFIRTIEILINRKFEDKYFYHIFHKLLVKYLCNLPENIISKKILINKTIMLIKQIKEYLQLTVLQQLQINITLFLLEKLNYRCLFYFVILKFLIK